MQRAGIVSLSIFDEITNECFNTSQTNSFESVYSRRFGFPVYEPNVGIVFYNNCGDLGAGYLVCCCELKHHDSREEPSLPRIDAFGTPRFDMLYCWQNCRHVDGFALPLGNTLVLLSACQIGYLVRCTFSGWIVDVSDVIGSALPRTA